MPNYCDYTMSVKGSAENVEEFIKIIKADYDYRKNEFSNKPHMWRVFEAEVYDDYYLEKLRCIEIKGYCAWSVYSCMLEGEHTYYNDMINESINYGTSLLKESERLNLIFEVYSEEPGMLFEEHYIVKDNKLIEDECLNYEEFYISEHDDYESFKNEYGKDSITEEEFNENKKYQYNFIKKGGIDWNGFTPHELKQMGTIRKK